MESTPRKGEKRCFYRGREVGRVYDEHACCTDDFVTLYECEIHGKCSLGPYMEGRHPQPICCLCEDFKED
jgi:hypothetical protein